MNYSQKPKGSSSTWIPKIVVGACLACSGMAYGQTISVSAKANSIDLGQTDQMTAKVTGLTNTAVNWLVGGVQGGNTTLGTINSAGLYTSPMVLPTSPVVQISAVSVANSKVVGKANITLNPLIPVPVTSHPRLWVTTNDLPRLRSWATASNPAYAKGMQVVLKTSVDAYEKQFLPNGVANKNYPDPGDAQGYTGLISEQYAAILAFNSLIDPDPTKRIKYAKYARNILMHAINEAAKGVAVGLPFRDPAFPIYNRASEGGEQYPLIVDWIYNVTDATNSPILTASDKATIQKVFLQWSKACINASTTGGDHPEPIGATNGFSLLPNKQPYRMASNNYYIAHARNLTLMALCLDPADDKPINPFQSASVLGNTERSYIKNATGAWLYQQYAMMGEPATIAADYGISGNGAGFGLAGGGLPPEGFLYGASFGTELAQLLALQTAGFMDTKLIGPQAHIVSAPVWDRFVQGYASSLTPTPFIPSNETYLGSVYQMCSYGDLLRLFITPSAFQPLAYLALLDHQRGLNTHDNAARWFAINAVQGGAAQLYDRIANPFTWGTQQSLLYFMLLDPAALPASDPRPALPTTFVDPRIGRILAHSDWGNNNTMFSYMASWESINHQDGNAGQFELFRNGEFLTKELSNYDNNGFGQTSYYHNSLAIQNWCANGKPNLGWDEQGEWANGSQWQLGANAGDPTTLVSNGPGYVFADSDLTKLYNRPNIWTPADSASDVTQATRSILWLNKDFIVVYDRATTNHSGLFKTFNLSFPNNPTISGNHATETLGSGQQLFVQTLLPANPTGSAVKAVTNLSTVAELEPCQYVYSVQDASKPADVRFLHVLQGADKGVSAVSAKGLTSTSGTPFDGAVFGSTAVFFPHSAGTVATTKFVVPTGVHTVYFAGLTPKSSFTATTAPSTNGTTITLTPGTGSSTNDSAGLAKVTF